MYGFGGVGLLEVQLSISELSVVGGGGIAGGLTSLEASLVRCFTFSETSPKTSRGDVFFKTSLEHRTVKQKVRCFSFQKAHSETKPTPPSLLLQHQQKEPSIWTGSSSLLRGL